MLPPPVPLPTSPTPNPSSFLQVDPPSTPAPQKARLRNLEQQLDELINQRTAAERKHRAEMAGLRTQLADAVGEAAEWRGKCKTGAEEGKQVERYRLEVGRIRAELELVQSIVHSRGALALHEKQFELLAFKQQLNKAQCVIIMRDHKLTRFKAREVSLEKELDTLVAAHNLNLEDHKALVALFEESRAEAQDLEAQVHSLQTELQVSTDERAKGEGELLSIQHADLESLRKTHNSLLKTSASQTTEINSLQAQIASLQVKEANLKDEKVALIKEEKARDKERDKRRLQEDSWRERERELLDEVDELRRMLEGVKERERREKDKVYAMRNNNSNIEMDLRKELEALEDEVETQVEETKRVEAQLILKEKEVRLMKKTIAALESSLAASTASLQSKPNSAFYPTPALNSTAISPVSRKPSTSTSKAAPKGKKKKAPAVETDDHEEGEDEDFQAEMDRVAESGEDEREAVPSVLKPKKDVKGKGKAKRADDEEGTDIPKPKPKPKSKKAKVVEEEEEEQAKKKVTKKAKVPAPSVVATPSSSPRPLPKSKPTKTSSKSAPARPAPPARPARPAPDSDSPRSNKRKPMGEPDTAAAGVEQDNSSPVVEEKKKKRKLGGGSRSKPAIEQYMSNTDGGGIPMVLSPIKGGYAPLPLSRGGFKLGKR